MIDRLRCCECGKFISDADYKSGKLKAEDIWDYDPSPGLFDVIYWCLRCKPDAVKEESNYVKNVSAVQKICIEKPATDESEG